MTRHQMNTRLQEGLYRLWQVYSLVRQETYDHPSLYRVRSM